MWDVFAILTYLTDLEHVLLHRTDSRHRGAARPGEESGAKARFSRRSRLGWRNSDREWRHFTRAYLFLAAFATPLVLSVHSVVSFDFAMALTPGWHATIFPPYFVAGAIFSGIGMVFTIIIPLRKCFKLEHYITLNDLDAAAKLCLFTSMVVGLAYLTEFQVAWMSGNKFEQDYFWNRVFGQWAWAAWIMLICNMVLPLSLWSQKLRRNTTWLFILSMFINLGMWFERFVIVVPSLSHEFEPWQWGSYRPTWVDYGILLGSFGWFFMWFLLFIKQLPVMAMAEIKEDRAAADEASSTIIRTICRKASISPTKRERRTNARRHRSIPRARLGGARDRRSAKKSASATSPSTRRRRATSSSTSMAPPAEQGAHLHAHLRPGRRDLRLLDRGVDLGLLADRRRRQGDRDLGAVHDHRVRGDGAHRRAGDGVRDVRRSPAFRG